MASRSAQVVFRGSARPGRGLAFAAVLAAVLASAACSTSGLDAAGPAAASAPGQPDLVGPNDTGTYPNLNIAPQQAAPQFTDAEAQAKLAALKAEGQAAQDPARAKGAGNDGAALKALAKNHGKDALKQIEGKCDPSLDQACK